MQRSNDFKEACKNLKLFLWFTERKYFKEMIAQNQICDLSRLEIKTSTKKGIEFPGPGCDSGQQWPPL